MIGNIKRPNMRSSQPFDPSSIFDPITNTATEEDFIRLLEKGVYDSSLIGKFVTLSNTVDYDGGKWVIADVNHDAENTGQTNCYDLISVDCFHVDAFGNTSTNGNWRDSKARAWLNNTFYDGFSSPFKARMINPKYEFNNNWYTDDKIIEPSCTEVHVTFSRTEGVAYPIFTDLLASRIKYLYSNGFARTWWLRTLYSGNNKVAIINASGNLNYSTYSNTATLAPIIRVQ